MAPFLYNFYKVFSFFLTPIFILILKQRLKKHKEDATRWKEKCGIYTIKPFKESPFWVHVASVGELNSATPLIKILLEYNNVIVTSGTVTSSLIFTSNKNFFKDSKFKAIHQFFPLDSPIFVKRFLKYFNPICGIFIESELWPNLLVMSSKNFPIFSVNTRISPKSLKKWDKMQFLFKWFFGKFKIIFPSNLQLNSYFKSLKINSVFLGNLKFSNTKEPNLKIISEFLPYFKENTVLFASTHEEEEEKLVFVMKTLLTQNINVILMPRHPERVPNIVKILKENNILSVLRTNSKPEKNKIFIIDVVGEALEFFTLANIIFMAGSLIKNIGGHNIIEPAKLQKAIITGPYYFNFQEIVEEFLNKNAIIVSDEKCLTTEIFNLFKNSNRLLEISKNAFEVSSNYTFCAESIANQIIKFLQK